MKKIVKIFHFALITFALVLGAVLLAQAQSITIDKDLNFGGKQILNVSGLRFSDDSILNSATGIGGGGWTVSGGKIYLTQGGNVGIGTTNPTSPLYVVGTTTIAGVLQVGGGGGATEAATSSAIYRTKYFDTDNTAYYLDPANSGTAGLFAGSVGIGNTDPAAYKLNVSGTINATGFYISGAQVVSSQWMTASGNVYFNSGNVGIGTSTPAYKLHVSGKIYVDDGTSAADIVANKIDAGTVDPVYTIGGVRYATYMAGMTGVKEETTGVALLRQRDANLRMHANDTNIYEYVIDFSNLKEGSDLWLFAKTTNIVREGLGNVAVLLTPNFDGKVWYEKDSMNKKITIYASPSPSLEIRNLKLEISYRLTAPRFDYRDWTNYSSGDWEGLNIDAFLKSNP